VRHALEVEPVGTVAVSVRSLSADQAGCRGGDGQWARAGAAAEGGEDGDWRCGLQRRAARRHLAGGPGRGGLATAWLARSGEREWRAQARRGLEQGRGAGGRIRGRGAEADGWGWQVLGLAVNGEVGRFCGLGPLR
jgi:hypothetical protein